LRRKFLKVAEAPARPWPASVGRESQLGQQLVVASVIVPVSCRAFPLPASQREHTGHRGAGGREHRCRKGFRAIRFTCPVSVGDPMAVATSASSIPCFLSKPLYAAVGRYVCRSANDLFLKLIVDAQHTRTAPGCWRASHKRRTMRHGLAADKDSLAVPGRRRTSGPGCGLYQRETIIRGRQRASGRRHAQRGMRPGRPGQLLL
jgi:hypothetical protein